MRARLLRRMGRRALLIAALVALGSSSVAVGAAAAAPVDPVGPAPVTQGTWIVTLSPGIDAHGAAAQFAHRVDGNVVGTYSYVLNGFAFSGPPAAATALSHLPGVTSVEPSRTLHAVEIAPNGILRTSAWAAHNAGYTGVTASGTPVRVAVVDTGIDLDHTDLA